MNSPASTKRSAELDILKGIAIIAVVVYHLAGSFLPFGYLGVEIFFVISGYLLMRSMIRSMENGTFSFWDQVTRRLFRFWPAVLAVSTLSLCVGFFVMLPDDYENLAQSVIASSGFLNNVLAAITTKNYWDVVNLFKPLMHTWYLGVLLQAYAVIIAVCAVCNGISKHKITVLRWITLAVTVISLVLYLSPAFGATSKFYFLPFRLYEITVGSLIALLPNAETTKLKAPWALFLKLLCLAGILTVIVSNSTLLSSDFKLLLTVALTVVYTRCAVASPGSAIPAAAPLAFLGRNSFSIYITHQCIVAFFYYAFIHELRFPTVLVFIAVVALFSVLVHFLVEKPVERLMQKKKHKALWIGCILSTILLCGVSGLIYLNAGVVRDVPELNITKGNAYRGMHAAYCDVPYSWDRDFSDSDKVKVLVIGDSFGRDWANILNESEISGDIEISYIYIAGASVSEKIASRVQDAHVVFYATATIAGVVQHVTELVPAEKLWVIGNKNFGNSNGYIYKSRFESDYYTKTQTISEDLISFNHQMKEQYGDHYIDMLEVVLQDGNQVRVFTDDGRFISQDCRHLTQSGAQFYAGELDLSWIAALAS